MRPFPLLKKACESRPGILNHPVMKSYQAPWGKSLIVLSTILTLVLRFHKRTVVVSPAEPEDFVALLNR